MVREMYLYICIGVVVILEACAFCMLGRYLMLSLYFCVYVAMPMMLGLILSQGAGGRSLLVPCQAMFVSSSCFAKPCLFLA